MAYLRKISKQYEASNGIQENTITAIFIYLIKRSIDLGMFVKMVKPIYKNEKKSRNNKFAEEIQRKVETDNRRMNIIIKLGLNQSFVESRTL